jgi:3-oxoacyl-[acyl-carrier protein] reductase
MSSPTALVTGAGGPAGIAAATCRALLRDGWRVCATGLGGGDVEAMVEELSASGDFAWQEFDLGDPQAPAAAVSWAHRRLGRLDGLVAAHARSLPGGVLEASAAEFDAHMAVNARATLLLVAEFARLLPAGTPGRVVTFVSGPPLRGEIAYAASKGAVEWLTLSAAAELAPRGISVNAIDPGPTQTGWMTPEIAAEVAARSPMGRAGRPEDAAELVAFLLSARGGWITGQVLRSDGGFSSLR